MKLPSNKHIRLAALAAGIVAIAGVVWGAFSLIDDAGGGTVMVQADSSAYKVKPDNAGGMEIPHQDKMVFNNADGKAGQVERIMPPPEQPMTDGQQVTQSPPSVAPQSSVTPEAPVATVASAPLEPTPPASVPVATPSSTVDQPVAAMGRVVQPSNLPTQSTSDAKTEAAAAFDVNKPSNSFSRVVTKEPAKEAAPFTGETAPGVTAPKQAETATTSETQTPPVENKPEANMAMEPVRETVKHASHGGARFQLASFTDRASAERAVAQLNKKYGHALQGSSLDVVEATVKGKGHVYRIQGGAESPASVCGSVKAAGGTCVVVHP